MDLVLKDAAIKMRRAGKTYTEIREALGKIPKSTLSTWLQKVELTATQKQHILNKMAQAGDRGRQKGGWTNHKKRLDRIAAIKDDAQNEFQTLLKRPIFLPGLTLYLAEGSKTTQYFQFMNSNPNLNRLMIRWLNVIGCVPLDKIKLRLYTHRIYINEKYELYWSKTLKMPLRQFYKTVYKPTPHTVQKNPQYKGCLRIEIGGSELFWKIMTWGDMMYKLFTDSK